MRPQLTKIRLIFIAKSFLTSSLAQKLLNYDLIRCNNLFVYKAKYENYLKLIMVAIIGIGTFIKLLKTKKELLEKALK